MAIPLSALLQDWGPVVKHGGKFYDPRTKTFGRFDRHCCAGFFWSEDKLHLPYNKVTWHIYEKEETMEPFKEGDKVRSLVGTIISNDGSIRHENDHLYRVQFDVTAENGTKINRVMRRDLLELVEAYVAPPKPGEIWESPTGFKHICLYRDSGSHGYYMWWSMTNDWAINDMWSSQWKKIADSVPLDSE